MQMTASNFQVVTFDLVPDTTPLDENNKKNNDFTSIYLQTLGVKLKFLAGRQYILLVFTGRENVLD